MHGNESSCDNLVDPDYNGTFLVTCDDDDDGDEDEIVW